MSLLAELFEGLETSTAGIDTLKTERIGSTAPALRFALSENVARDVTMNSREIAVLVGARHADVMQTIDRLIEKNVVLGCTPSAYTHEQNGQPYAQSLQLVDQHDGEPQHLIHTAATATLEWIAVRDQYVSHLMACCACYAPSGRYCAAGVELRQQYEQTPWERQP